jgi:hypothetical protein
MVNEDNKTKNRKPRVWFAIPQLVVLAEVGV